MTDFFYQFFIINFVKAHTRSIKSSHVSSRPASRRYMKVIGIHDAVGTCNDYCLRSQLSDSFCHLFIGQSSITYFLLLSPRT